MSRGSNKKNVRSGRQTCGVNLSAKHLPHGGSDTASKCPRVYIKTFGCQMNNRDSEALAGLLRDAGFKLSDSPDDADVILYNTCSVRQHAEERVWSAIGRLNKIKNQKSPPKADPPPAEKINSSTLLRIDAECNRSIKITNQNSKSKDPKDSIDTKDATDAKDKIIGIIGCMAQNYKDEIFRRTPAVDLVVGPNDLLSIPGLIKEIIREKTQALAVGTMEREQDFYVSDYREDKDHAYVVISEGCSNFCSYCVVPYVRGRLHCRNPRDILDEIKRAVDLGIEDVTLLGQNVNSYKDNKINFVKLLEMVNSIGGLKQFSFLTSHPKDTSEDLFIAIRDLDKLKKSLHLPVQSGSDRILKLMNRGYSSSDYRGLIDNYRKLISGELSTDIIVGFPTESQEDFQKTRDLLNDIGFDSAYIFKYSTRPHTQAEKLADDVPLKEKERRHKILLELQKDISNQKRCLKK